MSRLFIGYYPRLAPAVDHGASNEPATADYAWITGKTEVIHVVGTWNVLQIWFLGSDPKPTQNKNSSIFFRPIFHSFNS
jgi:hypothetical protein